MSDDTQEQATAQSNGATIINGVLVDVIDLGIKTTQYGPKRQVQLIFETDQIQEPTGAKIWVKRILNNSLHEMAKLRAFMRDWRGKDVTQAELKNGMQWDKILGKGARLEVIDALSKSGHPYLKLLKALPPGKDRL